MVKNTQKAGTSLWSGGFFCLFQGQLVSQLGTAVFELTLLLWLQKQYNSAGLMAAVMLAGNIPEIILAPLGGALADRMSRKRQLIVADLLSGLWVVAAGTLLFFKDTLSLDGRWVAFVAMAGLGVGSAFFGPALSAILPQLVPGHRLKQANGLIQSSRRLAVLLGQTAGGMLFTLLGAPLLFVLNGLSFMLSGLSETFLPEKQSARTSGGADKSLTVMLKEGLTVCRQDRWLMSSIAIIAVFHFFLAPIPVFIPFLVRDSLKLAPSWSGFLMAAMAVGTLVGYNGVALVWKKKDQPLLLIWLLFLCSSVLFVILALANGPWPALLALLGIGMAVGAVVVILITVIQTRISEEYLGRTMGLMDVWVNASTPLGLAVLGLMLDALRRSLEPASAIRIMILVVGLCIFLSMIILGRGLKQSKFSG